MASSTLMGLCFLTGFLLHFACSVSTLSVTYYDKICPKALPTIRKVVQEAVSKERRMGASLLRLHFHDCFVQGCDASILLDKTKTIDSEKFSQANNNSIRGFDVIDQIKSAVDKVCRRSVVSCADIVAVAARDSVVALGGPSWPVPLGRRDSTTASRTLADRNIPSPFMDLPDLIKTFAKQGLGTTDLVALAGGHTVGLAQCRNFRDRIYNETNIDRNFAKTLKRTCPVTGGDNNLETLDFTSTRFDSNYFNKLVVKKGLLHSDQELFNGGSTDGLVRSYSTNYAAFAKAFSKSMVKMGNIKPLTGTEGQIRLNCRKVN